MKRLNILLYPVAIILAILILFFFLFLLAYSFAVDAMNLDSRNILVRLKDRLIDLAAMLKIEP